MAGVFARGHELRGRYLGLHSLKTLGKKEKSRSDWIRTSDLMVPNHPRYQTALRPEHPLL